LHGTPECDHGEQAWIDERRSARMIRDRARDPRPASWAAAAIAEVEVLARLTPASSAATIAGEFEAPDEFAQSRPWSSLSDGEG
jgi:hypothetical protein